MIGSSIDIFFSSGGGSASGSRTQAVVIAQDGDTIQHDNLIGAASVEMIAANNMNVTEGFDFETATGTISNYPVMAGERHIIFYTKQ